MIADIQKLLGCRIVVFGGIAAVSFFSLAMALVSEAFLGLEPCILCIYQRWPFVIGIVFGLAGFVLKTRAKPLLALLGFNFLINAGIALYHTGVEQKWWASGIEGCLVPDFSAAPQTILENILSAPTARCDEIPWSDPVLGLSMANYNVVLCLGLAAVCFLSMMRIKA